MSESKKTKLTLTAFTIAAALPLAAVQIGPVLDDPKGTTETLKAQGYKPVEVGGGVWLGGDTADLWRTKFKAVAPNGGVVEGYATRGVFKGTTLRGITPVNE